VKKLCTIAKKIINKGWQKCDFSAEYYHTFFFECRQAKEKAAVQTAA